MMRAVMEFMRREDGGATGLEWVLVAEVMALGTVLAVLAIRRMAL
jgi:Flp pilus assembly pilin Flp